MKYCVNRRRIGELNDEGQSTFHGAEEGSTVDGWIATECTLHLISALRCFVKNLQTNINRTVMLMLSHGKVSNT